MVLTLALALCLAVAAPAGAQLATLQGNGIRLVYIDGSESFLVPHAARTFLNSLAFQKKLFGFDAVGRHHGAARWTSRTPATPAPPSSRATPSPSRSRR